MVKVNCKEDKVVHSFDKYHAFLDSDNHFYLIDGATDSVVCIEQSGCTVYDTVEYGSIEDFLYTEADTELVKVYKTGSEYEIIING